MLRTALILLIFLFANGLVADNSKVPPPKGDHCVEDEDWMRANHFETVLHQRDKTVLEGIRTKNHSLKNCIECHITPNANGEYARYSNSEEHFCANCHSYAAVSIDCFDCHADRPEVAIRQSRQERSVSEVDFHHGRSLSISNTILNSKLLSVSDGQPNQ